MGEGHMRKGLMWGTTVLALALSAWNAAAAEYRLRSGDRLEVTVWQDEKLNRVIVVAPDGQIAMPLAGRIKAGGRTLAAVESDLKARLQKQYSDEIDVTLAIAQIKEDPPAAPGEAPIDPSIYVTGEVAKPGQYFFKTRTNVLQAIALAGGLGPFAAEKRIKVRRKVNGSETLYEFDYAAFSEGEDLSGNMFLRSGDVIIVPEKRIFE
jgi:polysaccharide biosynthesis/export protein